MCQWADCWCRAWPPVRWIPSSGMFYGMIEREPKGKYRVFEYRYWQ
jgi:hypothetical protein